VFRLKQSLYVEGAGLTINPRKTVMKFWRRGTLEKEDETEIKGLKVFFVKKSTYLNITLLQELRE